METTTKVNIVAPNNKFVCWDKHKGGTQLFANRSDPKKWESFDLISLGEDFVAIRCHNGKFVKANGGGGGKLLTTSPKIGRFEKFQKIEKESQRFGFKTQNGHFISMNKNGKLHAKAKELKNSETFFITLRKEDDEEKSSKKLLNWIEIGSNVKVLYVKGKDYIYGCSLNHHFLHLESQTLVEEGIDVESLGVCLEGKSPTFGIQPKSSQNNKNAKGNVLEFHSGYDKPSSLGFINHNIFLSTIRIVSSKGPILGIHQEHNVLVELNRKNGKWETVHDQRIAAFDTNSKGKIVAILQDHARSVCEYDEKLKTWKKLNGSLKNLCVDEDGVIYGINPGKRIVRFKNDKWEDVHRFFPNDVVQLDVLDENFMVCVNKNGKAFRYIDDPDLLPFRTNSLMKELREIRMGGKGTVFGIDKYGETFQYFGEKWIPKKVSFKSLSVGKNGVLLGLSKTGHILRQRRGEWEKHGVLQFSQMSAVHDREILGITLKLEGGGGQVMLWDGKQWTQLPANNMVQVSINSSAGYVGIDTHENAFRFSPLYGKFKKLGKKGTFIEIDEDGNIYIIDRNSSVFVLKEEDVELQQQKIEEKDLWIEITEQCPPGIQQISVFRSELAFAIDENYCSYSGKLVF